MSTVEGQQNFPRTGDIWGRWRGNSSPKSPALKEARSTGALFFEQRALLSLFLSSLQQHVQGNIAVYLKLSSEITTFSSEPGCVAWAHQKVRVSEMAVLWRARVCQEAACLIIGPYSVPVPSLRTRLVQTIGS